MTTPSASQDIEFLQDNNLAHRFLEGIEREPLIAVDTEAASFHRYHDRVYLLQMSTRPYSWFKPRYGASWTRQDWGFAGHAATLCNERSGSDAEEFSDAFQRLKLGPVIGVRAASSYCSLSSIFSPRSLVTKTRRSS